MRYRGLLDRNGELFAYLEGNVLYTLDGEVTGRLEGNYVVDTAGNQIWRVMKDGVYTLDGSEAIGYFSSWTPDDG
ncbi:MAG: hypothetical protein PVH03_12280 [Chloroflexota bacterium]|jgi:hypothetical protein